jgi:hypothetical protein
MQLHYTPTKTQPPINGGDMKIQILSRGDEVNINNLHIEQLFNCRLSQEIEYVRKLFITKTQVIQLIHSRSKNDTYIVLGINNLSTLTKLKFKRHDGRLSLIFNNSERINYYVENVIECIAIIQKAMSIVGIEGTPSSKKAPSKKIETAEKMFDATLKLVEEFNQAPNIDIVLHVMDVLRESAERFSEANNNKYQDVITFIKVFLQKDEVIQLLDVESNKNKQKKTETSSNVNGVNHINDNNTTNGVNHINDNNNINDTTINNINNNKLKRINLEDVDTSSMEKLLQKCNDIDDENDDDFKIRQKLSIDSADAELRNMLGDMTNEFTDLLSTFSNPTNISSDDAFEEGIETFDLNDLDLLINEKDDMNSFIYKT